jgi:hypothetical protein
MVFVLKLLTLVCAILFLCSLRAGFTLDFYEKNGCAMSYFHLGHSKELGPPHQRYALYRYHPRNAPSTKLGGFPVLFIHGNAGSFHQFRSIASRVNLFLDAEPYGKVLDRRLDFYAVDFAEEFSAGSGLALFEQTHYVNECITFILQRYSASKIILVGHSMGGIISRGLYTLPTFSPDPIAAILTLGTPHQAPVVATDSDMLRFYALTNDKWRELTEHTSASLPLVISVAGGLRDNLVEPALTSLAGLVPTEQAISVLAPAMPAVNSSVDHQCLMWCHALVEDFSRVILDIAQTHLLDNSARKGSEHLAKTGKLDSAEGGKTGREIPRQSHEEKERERRSEKATHTEKVTLNAAHFARRFFSPAAEAIRGLLAKGSHNCPSRGHYFENSFLAPPKPDPPAVDPFPTAPQNQIPNLENHFESMGLPTLFFEVNCADSVGAGPEKAGKKVVEKVAGVGGRFAQPLTRANANLVGHYSQLLLVLDPSHWRVLLCPTPTSTSTPTPTPTSQKCPTHGDTDSFDILSYSQPSVSLAGCRALSGFAPLTTQDKATFSPSLLVADLSREEDIATFSKHPDHMWLVLEARVALPSPAWGRLMTAVTGAACVIGSGDAGAADALNAGGDDDVLSGSGTVSLRASWWREAWAWGNFGGLDPVWKSALRLFDAWPQQGSAPGTQPPPASALVHGPAVVTWTAHVPAAVELHVAFNLTAIPTATFSATFSSTTTSSDIIGPMSPVVGFFAGCLHGACARDGRMFQHPPVFSTPPDVMPGTNRNTNNNVNLRELSFSREKFGREAAGVILVPPGVSAWVDVSLRPGASLLR